MDIVCNSRWLLWANKLHHFQISHKGRTTHGAALHKTTCHRPNSSDSTSSVFDELNFFSDEADWDGLKNALAFIEWERQLSAIQPSEMMYTFLEICINSVRKFIPKRRFTDRKSSKIPRTRRILMRRRTKVIKQLSAVKTDSKMKKLTEETIQIERKLQQSYRHEKSEMEHKAVSAITRNSKYFFSYAKKFSTISTALGPLIDMDNKVISCPQKMADMLAEQYNSVFSIPKEKSPSEGIFQCGTHVQNGRYISDIEFSVKDIEEAISDISTTAAAGPDRFPAILLKQCKSQLAKPLFIIWRTSMDSGVIPDIMKTANIIPVHKGGSRGLAKNYRPIALTSHLIKVFEKVLSKSIVAFMETNNLFNPGQHGFRHGRSCLSQLITHYDHILDLLEQGHNVDVVYIDFAKAFDKVDFMVTMHKLISLGISGKVGKWIYSFLTHRTQQVIVNKSFSKPIEVKSGVPQGSVLGPLIFLILIGDINKDVNEAFLSSFADDTRIGRQIGSQNDSELLQKDLCAVYNWTRDNNMELNASKFECLRYGPNSDLQQFPYKSNTGCTIEERDDLKDLGVTMCRDGTFKKHIQATVKTAQNQCSWILRTFMTREVIPMLTLWKSLVQCKLDYCSQLWSPARKGDIRTIEMVQNSFLRKLPAIRHMSYWQKLKQLKLYSQERRRERYTIIYIWRMLEGQVPCINSLDGGAKVKSIWHIRRGRECQIPCINHHSPRNIQALKHATLPVRGQQLFNTLPRDIRNMTGCKVDMFKRRLDKYLSTIPDEPQVLGYTAQRRADSNSVLHMAKFVNAHWPSQVEVFGAGDSPSRRGCAYSDAGAQ